MKVSFLSLESCDVQPQHSMFGRSLRRYVPGQLFRLDSKPFSGPRSSEYMRMDEYYIYGHPNTGVAYRECPIVLESSGSGTFWTRITGHTERFPLSTADASDNTRKPSPLVLGPTSSSLLVSTGEV